MALRVEQGEQEEELAGDLADQAGDDHRQGDDADTIDGLLAEDDGRQEEEDDQQQHDLQDEESVQNGSTPPAEEAQAQGRVGRAMPAAYFMDVADMGGPEPPSQSRDSSGQHASHSGQQGHEYPQQQRYDRGHDHNGGRIGYGRGRGGFMGHDSRQGYGRGQQYGSRPGGWRPPEGHMGNMPPTGVAGLPHMMPQQHMMSAMHQGPGHRPPGPPVPPPRPPAGPPPSTSSQSSAKPPANLGMPSILRPGLPQEPSNGTATLPPTPSAHANGQSLGLMPGPKPPAHMMPPLLLPGHPPPLLMMPAITPGMGMHAAGWRPPGVPGPWGPQHAGVTSPRDVSPAAAAAAGWQGVQPWAAGPFAAPAGPRPNKWVRPGATVPATTAAASDTPAEPAESKEAELQRKLAIIEANKKQQEERRRKAAAAAAAGEPEAVSTAAPNATSKPAAAATPAALLKAHEEYIENLRRMIALQEAAVKGSDSSAASQGMGGEANERQGVKRAGSRSLSPSQGTGAAAAPPVKRARRVQRSFSTAASTGTDKSTLDAGDGLQFCEETEQGSQTAQPPVNGTHDELDVAFSMPEFVLGQPPALDEEDMGLGT